ncbi:major facilitator superfamily MFS_1 [Xylariomycetidae sp. FL0641]|nr:major facilitator superfamily MFS_1 [Xylariomycetidae sp. FL0641]
MESGALDIQEGQKALTSETERPSRERALEEAGQAARHRDNVASDERFNHSWRVICIATVLSALSLNSAIDATVITTSLPTIMRDIGGANEYAWVAQSYLFACTVPQPFYGQIANIFGRRNPLFASIALFVLGSGIAGGARNVATLIAGRCVQGLGTAGLNVLPEIVICDLVPPRYRGPYLSAMLSAAAVGSTIGPIIGGALAEVNWHWIFWLNIPISGAGALAIVYLLDVRFQGGQGWKAILSRVDFVGMSVFIPAMVALFFGIIMGGTDGYPWKSSRIVVPIVLGVAGWVLFHALQNSQRFCREPSVPSRLFRNRTSATGFLVIFIASVLVQAICYFLPIYFQALKMASPLMSGVYFLPFALALLPVGGTAAWFLSRTGQYKVLHWAGFALLAVGVGLFSILQEDSSRGEWIGFQVIAAAGASLIFTASLPSTLAGLPEGDVATATSTFAFVRAFGLVWGTTISSVAFNGQINTGLHDVDDASLRGLLADGGAYTFASGGGGHRISLESLDEPVRSEVITLYKNALSVVWLVFAGLAAVGFLSVFAMKNIELRKDHHTDFGLTNGNLEVADPVLSDVGIKHG